MYVCMYVWTSWHHKIFWLDFQQKLMLKSRNYFVTCMYVCLDKLAPQEFLVRFSAKVDVEV